MPCCLSCEGEEDNRRNGNSKAENNGGLGRGLRGRGRNKGETLARHKQTRRIKDTQRIHKRKATGETNRTSACVCVCVYVCVSMCPTPRRKHYHISSSNIFWQARVSITDFQVVAPNECSQRFPAIAKPIVPVILVCPQLASHCCNRGILPPKVPAQHDENPGILCMPERRL